ncbi:hypothetical protein J3B02_001373 [Coemansia erecta]|uniref:NmrA-like domain-containing protein n=1 Tax=Coemansia asiatica TaxID=1052880 RepID=A0A9W7XJ77_9FUNG|nr:hypothetical protein LPJ64_004285 [Coemansia asiatica]KAJ2856840.1 hypothetical protein J3B02_001373 [Coemansia erecta]KAJ2878957.1 hypothetical protein FB639_003221 [Coemansia asiatica]
MSLADDNSSVAPSPYTTVAVVSTGAYAEHFIKAFLQYGVFTEVRAVTRSPSNTAADSAKRKRISELQALGADIHEYTENTAEAFQRAFQGIDIVVSAVSVSAVPTQMAMIDGAMAAGVKWFLPSEFGVSHYTSRYLPLKGPLDHMVDVQRYLREKAQSSGLAYTIVYTGLAMDYLNPQSIGLIVSKREAVLVGRGGAKVSFTTLKDTVRLLIEILKRPEEMQNRTIRFAGSTSNMRELVKIVTGNDRGENVRILSIDEAKKKLCELAQRKDAMAFFMYCRILIEEGLAQIDRNPDERLDNHLFPDIRPEHIFETLAQLIHDLETGADAGTGMIASATKPVSPAAE